MEFLPLNSNITPLLKDKYKFGLSILPFGCMFSAIGLIMFPSVMAPGDWMLIILMCVGYMFGWLLNALVAKYIYNMSSQFIWGIYIQGRVPKSWFADGGWQGYCQYCKMQVDSWKKQRAKGKLRFISKISAYFYFVYFLLTLVIPYFFGNTSPDWILLLWPGFLWFLGFLGLSLIFWHSSERSCKGGQYFIDALNNIEVAVEETEDVEVSMGVVTYISSMLSCSLFIGLGLMVWQPNWSKSGDYGLPAYDTLTEFTGKAKIQNIYQDGLKFQLEGESTNYDITFFNEPSKDLADKIKGQEITILTDLNDSHGPMFSDERFHYVFELSIDGQLVIEYNNIYAEFKENRESLPYIAIPFILLGLVSAWFTHRQFRRSNR